MRRLLLWFLLVLLALPGLVGAQAQLINGSRVLAGWINYGLTTGTGTAYVLTLNPPLPGYVDGACFLFRAHTANTGDATLNVNGKGAVPLRKWSGGAAVALIAGDISAQQDVEVCYDATNGPRMQAFLWGTGAGITDTDKGDISVSGGGTIWTIDTGAVLYTKIQNVSATARLLGRNSAGAGPIEELTAATVKAMLGVTFGDLTGTATDAQIPDLNTLSTGLTPSRCVETDGTGKLGVAAGACGTGTGSTGISGASTNAPLYATGGTTATSTAPLTTGQVLLGSTGNPPVPTTLGTVQASQYGVVCNGATDTTTALQTVLNLRQAAPRTTTGFVISMPQGGQCKLTSTITIDSVNDLALQGNDVEFIWAGAAGIPMFVCRDCNLVRLENFRVRVSTSAPVSNVIQFENGSGSSVTPTRNTVQFVTIECTNGGCTNGVVMAQGAGGDANDEFNFFSHMNVNNYTGSAFRIEHAQSKHNFLSHVGGSGNGIGQHFLRVDPRGSFVCEHCTGGGHLAADFHIVNATDFATIRDSNFEGSAALLDTGGPSTTPYPVNIENVRWDNTNLRANNRVIVYQYRGPLRLSGLFVEQGPTPKPTEIFINPLGSIGAFVAEGNAIATTLADPFTNTRPTSQTSNIRYDGSAWIALQDRTQAIPPAAQTFSAGAVLTADACGGTKLLTATGAATTNTTNTFDAPAGGNVGCKMDVCNTSAFALTLDANANFRTIDGNNVVLGAATASAIQCTSVTQTGTQWVQLTGVGTTGSGGFVDVAGTPTVDQLALYVDANTIYGSSTLSMNVTDLDVSTATRTRPNKVGTNAAKPACAVGDTYFASDAPAGQNVYGCTAPNTWTLEGGTGGGNVSAVGTPSSGQAAEWTGATTIQGVATTGTGNYVKATSPSLTTPTIASFTNATHTHTNAAGGGQLSDTALSGPVSIAKGGTGATTLGAAGIAVVGSSNSWTAGVKQTFAPNATNAGLNPGSVAGDPSTPANGDLWYDSTNNLLRARINSTSVNLGTGGSGVTTDTAQRAAFYNTTTTVDGAPALTFDSTGSTLTSTAARITTIAATATLGLNDGPVVACTGGAADVTLTLPAAAATTQRKWSIVKVDAGAGRCLVKGNGTETINGSTGMLAAATQRSRVDLDLDQTTGTPNWSGIAGKTAIDLTTDVGTSILPSANGGTANAFFTVAGPATSAKTFTFPNANATIPQIIASGTATLGTSAIASGACATTVTVSATGVATTDTIAWTPNADISAVTGYAPVTTGALIIYPFPTANNVGFKVCNPTSASITPGAVTLNFRVAR